MSKRKIAKSEITMELIVGVVFIVAMVILGFFTIILNGDKFARTKIIRQVDFKQVGGVRVGDKILLRGVNIGQVSEMEIPEGFTDRVRLTIKLKKAYDFYEGYLAEIRSSSVLGGSFIYVELGDNTKNKIPEDEVLVGKTPVDVFAEAGRLVEKLNDAMKDVNVFTKGMGKTNSTIYKIMNEDKLYVEAIDAFKVLSESGKKVGSVVDELKGITDSVKTTMAKFENAGTSITEAGEAVKVASQSVGAAATSIKGASDNINLIISDVRAGKGTIGKLLTDDSIYKSFDEAAAAISVVATKASDGESSFGRLLNDDGAMYDSVKVAFDGFGGTMDNAQEITAYVKEGKGTIGKLVYDETVWRDLKQAIKDIQGAIDDFREQAPILTFGSFIFGSL